VVHKRFILGRTVDKLTLSSSSTDRSRSLFLLFIVVTAENLCSHRYDVENGVKLLLLL